MKRTNPFLGFTLLPLLFATLSSSAYSQTAAAPADPEVLKAEIQKKMEAVGIMGLAACVIVDREIVWKQGFGFSDWRMSRPFTPDTVMNVASVSKTVLGVAMMQAVEAGTLSLDEDISQYLPFKVTNPHCPGEKITLRHLATHTSGITDRWDVYKRTYNYDGDPKLPLESFLRSYFETAGSEYSKENFLTAKPGEMREYSNIGAALAGLIVERAGKMPLNTLTKRRIFNPLKMSNTGWFLREIDPKKHSALFVSQNGLTFPIQTYGGVTYPDGGVRTSLSDLSVFFSAMLNDGAHAGVRILSPEAAREMQRFQFADHNRPTNYPAKEGNSGLFWRTKYNGTRVGHGGNDPGVSIEMLTNLDRSIGVVLMSNTSLGGQDRAVFGQIFELIWEYGEKIKQGRRAASKQSRPAS